CNVCAFGYLLSLLQVRWWIAASVLMAVSIAPEVITRHASLMSEPLFLLLMQLAFVFTLKKQLGWAALFAAFAPMQRHVGLTVIAACGVYILLKYGWKR